MRVSAPGTWPLASTAPKCGGRILSPQYVLRAIQRRWRLVAGIGLLTCVAVGIFVFGRKHHTEPVRYRSTASVRVARAGQEGQILLELEEEERLEHDRGAEHRALGAAEVRAPGNSIRDAALRLSHVPRSSGIGFGAKLSSTQDVLSLVVTAPTRIEAQTVASNWAKEFAVARKAQAKEALRNKALNLDKRVNQLHNELLKVDAILVKIMPIVYHGILRYNNPNGNYLTNGSGPPPVPEQGSVHALNLANERIQLLAELGTDGQEAAQLRITNVTPEVFAQMIGQTPALRVSHARATTLPALGGLFGGLLFALGAALLVDRADRTIRDPEEAALTFSSPVLSIIPADGEDFAVIAEPNSLAAEAYRGLAAMSIATDRLPKAIMVSTPTGDAHAQVAANFAAASRGSASRSR